MKPKFTIEKAKTDRSKCKVCNGSIKKEDIRFGSQVVVAKSKSGGEDHTGYLWKHVYEISKRECAKILYLYNSFQLNPGMEKLSVKEKDEIAEILGNIRSGEPLTSANHKPLPENTAYIIEKAKSGRASCGECKQKIEKGTLRFGATGGKLNSTLWRHLKEVTKKQMQNAKWLYGELHHIPGLSTFPEKERMSLVSDITEILLSESPKKKSKLKVDAISAKHDDDTEILEDMDENQVVAENKLQTGD
ncbi:hypothetical protein HK099_004686 [Clydaea vesicula]|uniref:PARP-type domain-containing protein n=1 Tax=Clydaea vesicula TaxID=447962 RepID=A0AAD5U3D9_9FUNG|nr:hypothetical protein HK099_004686 [Clydaea vesicula]